MNSAAEAQVLRRGLVPNIRTNAVSPEWLEAQKAKWFAKQEHGAFEPFDTFDTASPAHIKKLGKEDTAAWIYHYRSVNVVEQTKINPSAYTGKDGAWGVRIDAVAMTYVQETLRDYLRNTRTSVSSFAKACKRDPKWVRNAASGVYAYMYEITRDVVMGAIERAPHGYTAQAQPKEASK